MQVSSNGYISLGSSISLHYHRFGTFSSATKHSVVAPFASDIDISAGGSVSYQVHSSGSSSALLRQVSNFIKTSQDVNFLGSWMLIAYWSRVPYYGGPAVSKVWSLFSFFLSDVSTEISRMLHMQQPYHHSVMHSFNNTNVIASDKMMQ